MHKCIYLILVGLVAGPLYAGEIVEVELHGMTCAFCVDAVQRNLAKLPDVEKAEVSLQLKKVRVYGKTAAIDRDRVRRTIVDAGFTPIAIKEVSDE